MCYPHCLVELKILTPLKMQGRRPGALNEICLATIAFKALLSKTTEARANET